MSSDNTAICVMCGAVYPIHRGHSCPPKPKK